MAILTSFQYSTKSMTFSRQTIPNEGCYLWSQISLQIFEKKKERKEKQPYTICQVEMLVSSSDYVMLSTAKEESEFWILNGYVCWSVGEILAASHLASFFHSSLQKCLSSCWRSC